MGRMPLTRVNAIVILGPCPGCFLWTLEYEQGQFRPAELTEMVESVLQDHVDECSGLEEIVRTLL